MAVNFYEAVDDELLKFAVIIAKTDGKYVFCKHKDRSTLEIPGGHREAGEAILDTAKRELYEETGALDYDMSPSAYILLFIRTTLMGRNPLECCIMRISNCLKMNYIVK